MCIRDRLLDKGCTTNLKGFKVDEKSTEGLIRFDDEFNLKFEPKKSVVKNSENKTKSAAIYCPKCKKGTILKGQNAYGCSNHKNGCNFIYPFSKLREIANGKKITRSLFLEILNTK